MDKLQKKQKIRDALKNVIYQSLNEALQLIEKEETEENVEKLNSYRETLTKNCSGKNIGRRDYRIRRR